MKFKVLTLALAATAFGSLAANAQTTTIIEERRDPAVIVTTPAPSTSTRVEKDNAGLLGNQTRTTTETTGMDGSRCKTKTTETNTLLGSSTSSRSHCD